MYSLLVTDQQSTSYSTPKYTKKIILNIINQVNDKHIKVFGIV